MKYYRRRTRQPSPLTVDTVCTRIFNESIPTGQTIAGFPEVWRNGTLYAQWPGVFHADGARPVYVVAPGELVNA